VFFSLFHRMRGSTALLEWRVGAFSLGAVLGLAGIFLNISWLVSAALIVLLGGVVLRRWTASDSESEEQEPTMHE
jgi:hypothetical protein